MYFFRSTLSFFATLLLFSTLFAQTDSTEVYNNSLEKGSRSLQFRITDNFTLTSFEGSDLSFKRHTSDNTAQRLGLGIVSRYDSNNGETEIVNTSRLGDSDGSSTLISLNLNAIWLRYFSPKKRMSFYWGVGPVLGFSLRKDNANNVTTFQDMTMITSESDIDRTTFSVGGLLVFGTEFFLHKQISLTAEYRSTSSYSRESEERSQSETDSVGNVSAQKSNLNTNRFTIGSSTVYFGLSVYF